MKRLVNTRQCGKEDAAHSDEVDDEGIEEPVQEFAEQLSPLVHVRCGGSLVARGGSCRGEPVAVDNGKTLEQSVKRGRFVPPQGEEGGDVCASHRQPV